jgi:hypothetical protein
LPGNTESDESFAWTLQRLRECTERHSACNSSVGSPLPKRVLDLGTSPKQRVRLYHSEAEVERYACLSHCWGSIPLLQTISMNLSAHQAGIEWDLLPRTYQETISFARKLQIRYLWIDSLCIIQDDEDDWRMEAAKMAAIYRGAFLTISATRSPGNDIGLISVPPRERIECHRLSCLDGDGPPQGIWVRPHLEHVVEKASANMFSFGRQISYMVVFERGWVLQERLLSSRILHFGPDELIWEFHEDSACECAGMITDKSLGPRYSSQLKLRYNSAHLSSLNKEELMKCWQSLVEEYTTLKLTYDRDIFPAMSGISKQFQLVYECQFFAGLWETDLLSGLLWTTTSHWLGRPETWRAPTWSWASIKAAVQFEKSDIRYSCTVSNVSCKPAGPDPTGELTSGTLTMCGRLMPAVLTYPWPVGTQIAGDPFSNLCTLDFLSKTWGNTIVDYNITLPGPGFIESGVTVYCFHFGDDERRNSYFLILRYMDSPSGVFERIGLAQSFNVVDLKTQDFEERSIKII